eukprot:Gb_41210 [translate_table: standard]
MPVNLKRLIWNAQKTFNIDFRKQSDMHPTEIIEEINKLGDRRSVHNAREPVCLWANTESHELPSTPMLHFTVFIFKFVLVSIVSIPTIDKGGDDRVPCVHGMLDGVEVLLLGISRVISSTANIGNSKPDFDNVTCRDIHGLGKDG